MVFHHDRGQPIPVPGVPPAVFHVTHGVVQSVGRIGSCHDNALAESFWGTLKREPVSRFRFASRADARRAIISRARQGDARGAGRGLLTPEPSPLCRSHAAAAVRGLRASSVRRDRQAPFHATPQHTGTFRRRGGPTSVSPRLLDQTAPPALTPGLLGRPAPAPPGPLRGETFSATPGVGGVSNHHFPLPERRFRGYAAPTTS